MPEALVFAMCLLALVFPPVLITLFVAPIFLQQPAKPLTRPHPAARVCYLVKSRISPGAVFLPCLMLGDQKSSNSANSAVKKTNVNSFQFEQVKCCAVSLFLAPANASSGAFTIDR